MPKSRSHRSKKRERRKARLEKQAQRESDLRCVQVTESLGDRETDTLPVDSQDVSSPTPETTDEPRGGDGRSCAQSRSAPGEGKYVPLPLVDFLTASTVDEALDSPHIRRDSKTLINQIGDLLGQSDDVVRKTFTRITDVVNHPKTSAREKTGLGKLLTAAGKAASDIDHRNTELAMKRDLVEAQIKQMQTPPALPAGPKERAAQAQPSTHRARATA